MTFQPGDHVTFPNPRTQTVQYGILFTHDEPNDTWTVVHTTTGIHVEDVPTADLFPDANPETDGINAGTRVISYDPDSGLHISGVVVYTTDSDAQILTSAGRKYGAPLSTLFHTPASRAGTFRTGDRVSVQPSLITDDPDNDPVDPTGTVVRTDPDRTVTVHLHATGRTLRLNTVDVDRVPPADYGDWVVLPDGSPGAVVRVNPTWWDIANIGGYAFEVMLPGGGERSFYAHEGDAFDAFEVIKPDDINLTGSGAPARW